MYTRVYNVYTYVQRTYVREEGSASTAVPALVVDLTASSLTLSKTGCWKYEMKYAWDLQQCSLLYSTYFPSLIYKTRFFFLFFTHLSSYFFNNTPRDNYKFLFFLFLFLFTECE